jgi:hypothetical protein
MAFQNKEINNSNEDNPRLETVGADQIIQSNTLLNHSKITNLTGSCSITTEHQQLSKQIKKLLITTTSHGSAMHNAQFFCLV